MSGPSIRATALPFKPFIYPCAEEVQLPKMDECFPDKGFLQVFKERRSIKRLGSCSLDALSQLLYYAFKPYMISIDDYGVTVYRSASPSAGGRHPIDILVGLLGGGSRKLYLYQPVSHSLRRLTISEEKQQLFFSDVENTLPFGESMLLWFSIQYMRTASKYTDYMSLIWRDVGAQLCCLQQAAKYVGLDSCPIGYLAEDTFDRLFESDALLSGGGLIVGERDRIYTTWKP